MTRCFLLAIVLAAGVWMPAHAQPFPNTPAVTREFTVFVGNRRVDALSRESTYFEGVLFINHASRESTVFEGDLRSDAWSREVSVERGPQFCAADWDNSGGEANSSDFLAFLNDFSSENPAADLAPVVTGDGVFDSSDFLVFLNLYAEGC